MRRTKPKKETRRKKGNDQHKLPEAPGGLKSYSFQALNLAKMSGSQGAKDVPACYGGTILASSIPEALKRGAEVALERFERDGGRITTGASWRFQIAGGTKAKSWEDPT